jgi:hypothetical protein
LYHTAAAEEKRIVSKIRFERSTVALRADPRLRPRACRVFCVSRLTARADARKIFTWQGLRVKFFHDGESEDGAPPEKDAFMI